jgi:hypothetical protein
VPAVSILTACVLVLATLAMMLAFPCFYPPIMIGDVGSKLR